MVACFAKEARNRVFSSEMAHTDPTPPVHHNFDFPAGRPQIDLRALSLASQPLLVAKLQLELL